MAYPADVEVAQEIIGRQFNDERLLEAALQAAGSGLPITGAHDLRDGNKRLALLGDSILKTALLSDWYSSRASRGESWRDAGGNTLAEIQV